MNIWISKAAGTGLHPFIHPWFAQRTTMFSSSLNSNQRMTRLFFFFLICWSFEEALIIFLTSCVIIHPSSTGTCFARKFALALKAWNFVSCSGHAEQRGTLLSFVLIPGHAWGVWVTLGLSSEAIGGLNTLRLRELNILQNGQHRHEGRG